MSKSRGEVLDLDQLIARGIHPLAFRWFVLGAGYRQQLAFSLDAVHDADRTYRKLRRRVARLCGEHPPRRPLPADAPELSAFRAALADDLNAPRAVAALWELLRDAELPPERKASALRAIDSTLALSLCEPLPVDASEASRIEELIAERTRARSERDFARADAIRGRLASEGIALEDAGTTTRWRPIDD